MSDLIDRQKVIDEITRLINEKHNIKIGTSSFRDGVVDGYARVRSMIESYPSAQPDLQPTCNQLATDLISRQAAIEAIHEDADWLAAQGSDWQVDRMERDKSILKSLPSAEPERWIPTKVKPDPDLPEDDMSGYFLVTLHTYGNIGFDMDEYKVKKMRWNRVNGWVFPVHSPAWIEEALTQEVLAWKPCPEPYREDGVE